MSKRVRLESELVDTVSIAHSQKKFSSPSKKSVSKKITTKSKAGRKPKQQPKPANWIKQGVYGRFSSYKKLCEALEIIPAKQKDRPKQKEFIKQYYILKENQNYSYETYPLEPDKEEYVYSVTFRNQLIPINSKNKYNLIGWKKYVGYVLTNSMVKDEFNSSTGEYRHEGYGYVQNNNEMLCAIFYRTRLVRELLVRDGASFTGYSYQAIKLFDDKVINPLRNKVNSALKYYNNERIFKIRKTYHYKITHKEKDNDTIIQYADDNLKDSDPDIELQDKSIVYQYDLKTLQSMDIPYNKRNFIYANPVTTAQYYELRKELMLEDGIEYKYSNFSIYCYLGFEIIENMYDDYYDYSSLQELKFLTEFFIIFRAEKINLFKKMIEDMEKSWQRPETKKEKIAIYNEVIEMINKYCVPSPIPYVDLVPQTSLDMFEIYDNPNPPFYLYTEEDLNDYEYLVEKYLEYYNDLQESDDIDSVEDTIINGLPISQWNFYLDKNHYFFMIGSGQQYHFNALKDLGYLDYKLTQEVQNQIDEILNEHYSEDDD